MNYFDYIEEKSCEIQVLLDKQNLGLRRINQNLIVSMPISEIPKAEAVTPKELVLYVIEGEQRVDLYHSKPNDDGLFADLCNRAPFMFSAILLGSTAAEKGTKTAMALLIPITAAFVLTRMITRRLDGKIVDLRQDKEKDLSHILGYGSQASKQALRSKPFEGKIAEKSAATVQRQIDWLEKGMDVYQPLLKLKIIKRRHHYQNG